MKLIPIMLQTALECLTWRNECLEVLRTSFALTEGQQIQFWEGLQDRNSPHRYWQNEEGTCVVGLTYIDWINSNAEISLIVAPERRGTGLGDDAVDRVLDVAFNRMNLHQVYGECYKCSKSVGFWYRRCPGGVWLPHRKYWNGKYHDSYYFWIINDK